MTSDVELLPLHLLEAFSAALKGERGELDAWLEVNNEDDVRLHVEAYARANVAHATAAKDAEIAHERWLREQAENRCVAVEDQREALRAEVERWKSASLAQSGYAYAGEKRAAEAEARAERLAKALREARDMVEDWAGYASEYFQDKHDLQGDLAKLDAALRDQEEGR